MPGSALLNDIASALDRSLPVSLSLQLKGLIEYGIACGELPAGTRLPSVRELAHAGGIAPMPAAAVSNEPRRTDRGAGRVRHLRGGWGAAELLARIRPHPGPSRRRAGRSRGARGGAA